MTALQIFNLIAGSGFCVHAITRGDAGFAVFFGALVAAQVSSILTGGLA
ncbi:hypothetical protein LL254_00490 [Marinobacter nauticus]|nr:hypothetical protein [Marinobacter nauticus]MCC4269184.1 hypothetical protein [Marinobacter nauticus]